MQKISNNSKKKYNIMINRFKIKHKSGLCDLGMHLFDLIPYIQCKDD